jgi:hypothetical protein
MTGIVGHSTECNITIDGHSCSALLDTGSNVSTICHSKYTEMFSQILLQSLDEFQLDIEGAGGHKLPYSGYIEVDVTVPGITNPVSCLMLVVPDTRYAQKVPVILGTNVLEPMMEAVEQLHGIRYQQTVRLPDALYFTFRCLKLQARNLRSPMGK